MFRNPHIFSIELYICDKIDKLDIFWNNNYDQKVYTLHKKNVILLNI